VSYKKNPTHWTDQILLELEKTAESETEAKNILSNVENVEDEKRTTIKE
jgi:hypothetical protein